MVFSQNFMMLKIVLQIFLIFKTFRKNSQNKNSIVVLREQVPNTKILGQGKYNSNYRGLGQRQNKKKEIVQYQFFINKVFIKPAIAWDNILNSMCQNSKAILMKINHQLSLVLELANEVKHQLFSAWKFKNPDSFLFKHLERMQVCLSQIPYFGDQEIDRFETESSMDADFGRKNMLQIIGIGQFGNNNFTVKLQKSCLHEAQNTKNNLSGQNLSLIRGPYRSYGIEQKLRVIKLYRQGRTFASISRWQGIPQKNIVRWCRNGVLRKEGAGRKIGDVEMQRNILKWIRQSFSEGDRIRARQIREKAIQYSTKEQFKSSKGWFKNFIRRHALNQAYDIL